VVSPTCREYHTHVSVARIRCFQSFKGPWTDITAPEDLRLPLQTPMTPFEAQDHLNASQTQSGNYGLMLTIARVKMISRSASDENPPKKHCFGGFKELCLNLPRVQRQPLCLNASCLLLPQRMYRYKSVHAAED
jgi:hypothetical protein